jgi:hypothetical protein
VPIARYFLFVGGTLAVLLVIADRCLPTPSAMFAKQLAIDRSIIRIKSAHKWPEKIVLDTSQPTITPPAALSVRLSPEKAGDQSNLEAFAELMPDTPAVAGDHPTLRIKRGLATIARSKRVTRGPVTHQHARAEAGADCCQLGWIDDAPRRPNAMLRRHVVS